MSFPDPARARKMAALAVAATAVFMVLCLLVVELVGGIAADQAAKNQPAVPSKPVEEEAVEVPSEPFYVLLIGSDSRKGTALYTGKANEHSQVDQHADIITLVRVDPTTPQITLLTIPRDTQMEGESRKINEALAPDNDPQAVVEVVERLTGVEIPYYFMTTFIGFEQLVDGMCGVTVDVPETVMVPDPSDAEDLEVEAGDGKQLNGSEALVVARARKEYPTDQDALRQVNVRNLEAALIEKAVAAYRDAEVDANAEASLSSMMKAFWSNVDTNMDAAVFTELLRQIADNPAELIVYSGTGPYAGDVNEDEMWVVPQDGDAWGDLMAAVDAGGDPAEVIPNPEFTDR